ncbi:MAG: DUF962 domain-containing protein [Gammaproteobacteria bacterium]|nr:DUF962 domain-containing protein [Gammaproteobacteria bacterium]NNM01153.1 DUF962 domain-containing protein [Gammaproteobacteria bacterium]
MRTMHEWFELYGASHRNPLNEAVHWICVPLIVYSLVGLLSLIPVAMVPAGAASWLHPGTALLGLGLVFFLLLSLPITAGMLVFSAVILALVAWTNGALGNSAWAVYAAVFVGAWIGQFIGHKVEGAKPSFFDDVKFLLIGPAWLLSLAYRKLGIRF